MIEAQIHPMMQISDELVIGYKSSKYGSTDQQQFRTINGKFGVVLFVVILFSVLLFALKEMGFDLYHLYAVILLIIIFAHLFAIYIVVYYILNISHLITMINKCRNEKWTTVSLSFHLLVVLLIILLVLNSIKTIMVASFNL